MIGSFVKKFLLRAPIVYPYVGVFPEKIKDREAPCEISRVLRA